MDLTDAVWRKSSYSNGNGGACVEITVWRKSGRSSGQGGACVEVADWRKSSRSAGNGGDCVEVGRRVPSQVVVRDSKDPDGPRLTFAPQDWQAFTAEVRAGRYDLI